LGLNNSAAGRPFRVRFRQEIQTENSTARSEVCVFSFAASCEGRAFGDEKGWKVARWDGVELRHLLF
jgi:hypothetical protein